MQYYTLSNDPIVRDKNKNGQPYISKKGFPYKMVTLQVQEMQGKWLSGFSSRENDPVLTWKSGDKVLLEVEQNGEYLNFRVPKREDIMEAQVKALNERITRIEGYLRQKAQVGLKPATIAQLKSNPQATQEQIDNVEVELPEDELPF